MKYIFKRENQLTKKEKKELHELLDNLLIWSIHIRKYLYWSSKPTWRVMLYENNDLVGSLSVVQRQVVHNGNRLNIAGVGNVGIKKEYQGKGYAQGMLKTVENKLMKNFHCALLFCDEKRTKLYEKVGYLKIRKPVTYYSKSSLKKEPVSMILPMNMNPIELTSIINNGLHIGRGTW